MKTTEEKLINGEDNDNEQRWNDESNGPVYERIQLNEGYGILI